MPKKLHMCPINELESIYRQIQSGIWYDENILAEFRPFAKKYIDKMIEKFEFEYGFKNISLEDYYKKLGNKKDEYIRGYKDYCNTLKLKMIFKMHNKSDEKLFISFGAEKIKSRNICAQQPMGKILLGIICELGMQVLHKQKWCGPGTSLRQKSEKFSKWCKELGYFKMICCDGSAFDSTQHIDIIECVDAYFLNQIVI